MIRPTADDLYARLDLESNATSADIKRAFVVAVKKHPPEKDAENYKLIREAYDTLGNDQSRHEYDSRSAYGPEIAELEEQLSQAKHDEDTSLQIRLFKKLIILAPQVGLYRNSLGLAYMENEEYTAAASQFERAVEIDGRNATYLLNLGHAFAEQDRHEDAESYFRKAWDLDPEDYAAPRALAKLLFFDMKRTEEAHEVLDRAILADDKVDYQDFFCMHDKIFFYVLVRDESGIDEEIARISEVATTTEDREFAAYTFAHMAAQLADVNVFVMAGKLAEAGLGFAPGDEDLQELHRNVSRMAKLDKQVDAVLERKDFPDYLKAMVATLWQLNFSNGNRQEIERQKDQMFETLPHVMDADPHSSDIKKAITIIRQSYSAAFEWQDRFFNMLLEMGSPSHIMLKCTRCGNEARADGSAIYNTYGLSCPKCHSDGPFRAVPSSFSSGPAGMLPHNKPSGGGCYIATAAYRGIDHPDVLVLRKFRDERLMASWLGQSLVKIYCRISPTLARSVLAKERPAQFVRKVILKPFVDFLKTTR